VESVEKCGCPLRREGAVKNSTKTWTQDPTVRGSCSSPSGNRTDRSASSTAVRDENGLRRYSESDLGVLEGGNTLAVSKLDRLGRTQSEVVARLASLQERGVYVRTLDGLLNTASLGKMAPLVVGLLTGLAEVERSLIQERTRESVEHRRRTGGKLGGRPPLPEGRQDLVRRLRGEGKSYREVAEVCGVSIATAHRYGKG
jgi:hypothetical protein